MYIRFIKHLTNSGIRVFSTKRARQIAIDLDINPSTILSTLHRLEKKKVVTRLMKGIYCLAPEFLTGIPIHEYEIALALADPSAISHLSAMSYHKLTDQISSIVYVLTLSEKERERSSYSTYVLRGITYRIIRTKKEWYWGIEKKWLASAHIEVTDLERTLIDGLLKPKYCGGFREVLDAFDQAKERIDYPKIISYAQKISASACKRLGWVVSHLKVDPKYLEILKKNISASYTKLDTSRPSKGKWNQEWYIIENL